MYRTIEDTTVWKVVRRTEEGFTSLFHPENRVRQEWIFPKEREFRYFDLEEEDSWAPVAINGTLEHYELGKWHLTSTYGFYVYVDRYSARVVRVRNGKNVAVLRCTVPLGTRVYVGTDNAGDAWITPELFAVEEVIVF